MAGPTCYYCTRPATEECHTCGRLYCTEHGEDVCLRCLSPEAATPSVLVFRGAILALVVGSLLAVFLVLSPPESKSGQPAVRTLSPTPAVSATATPTPPGRTATAPRTITPGASPSASAAPTGAPTATTYTIQPGDVPSVVAEKNGVSLDQLRAANPTIDFESGFFPGQVLTIPAVPR